MRIQILVRALIGASIALATSGCSFDEYVKVQNQLDEAVDFSWWDVAPDQGMVVTVRIPARTTVRFRSGAFIMKNGTGFLGVPPTCGLSYRGSETNREIVKRDALAGFCDPEWLDTHRLGERGRRLTLFFVLTQKDIVVVLDPKKVQNIKNVQHKTNPVTE